MPSILALGSQGQAWSTERVPGQPGATQRKHCLRKPKPRQYSPAQPLTGTESKQVLDAPPLPAEAHETPTAYLSV